MLEAEKLNLYYDHYKDTFTQIKENLKKRDKLTLLMLILMAVQVLFVITPEESAIMAQEIVLTQFNVNSISFVIIDLVCLASLVYTVLGYYQICLNIEKNYIYLHNIEFDLSQLSELKIDREGGFYLANYPFISNMAHVFYAYILPSLAVMLSLIRGILIIWYWNETRLIVSITQILAFIILSVFSVIYIIDRRRIK